ncbi:MAG TPA: hypothetical protein DEP87_03395 [Candidatus Pacebacteria bacterium]|nr:hypothetical protein [Candidatus Paceibacterota bacterium]
MLSAPTQHGSSHPMPHSLIQPPLPQLNWLKIVGFSIFLALILSFSLLILTAGILSWVAWLKLQPELTARQLDLPIAVAQAKAGWELAPITTDGRQNWLILGVDTLATRGDVPPLTDTMMVASFKTQAQTLTLLSLPRDLWLDGVQTKINALYAYGQSKPAEPATQLVTTTISQTLNLPIHRTFVISLDQLQQLINLLDGIEINLPAGFTDPFFPRPDVDVRVEHDPVKLYEIVTFEPGLQTLSADRALKYVRSRHSAGAEGTDTARAIRQQLVIEAIASKLTSLQTFRQKPTLILDLWQWYHQNFAETIGISEIVSLIKPAILTKQLPIIQTKSLAIQERNYQTNQIVTPGVIFHPVVSKTKYQGQWVYIIPDLPIFQAEIKNFFD